jgi:DNA-directed RNA polymerase specialized sigma24 family protein
MRDRQYRAYTAALDRVLVARFGTSLTPQDREELTQDAFTSVHAARARGTEIRNEEALLVRAAVNAAKSRLRSHDRHRREPFDPHDSPHLHKPDGSVPVDVAVLEAEEDRRVRRLIEQLDDPRARAVLKLRIELGLDWHDIAAYLGLGRRQTYSLLSDAGHALWSLVAQDESGAHSAQLRNLLVACEMGIATADQRRKATAMMDDPHARALLAELRGLGRQAAAALPLPPVAADPSSGRVAQMLADAKQHIADAGQTAKQHAVALLGRAPGQETASQLAVAGGARGSGSVAVAVVACIGLGSGAAVGVKECIDHGVPIQLVGVIPGVEEPRDDPAPQKKTTAPPDPPPTTAPSTPPPAPADPESESAPEPQPDPEPEPDPGPTPAPPSGDSLSGLSRNPTATPAPAPTPAPTTGGGGGASGTSSGTDFGGL